MLTYKVVVIGDPSVGKTSIVTRLAFNRFASHVSSTIGASFISHIMKLGDDQIRLNIWDTAGQEKFRSMVSMYYRDADFCIIVFDITKHSVSNVNYWIDEYLHKTANPHPKFVLVANKTDLDKYAKVSNDIRELAEEKGVLVFETSALNGNNVEELFKYVSKILLEMPAHHRLTVSNGEREGNYVNLKEYTKYHCCGGQ